MFDIDVQGALRIKNNFGEKALTIFIKPPSFDILVERLTQRNTESEESLKKRIDKASLELTFENKFDVVIENIVLEDAFMEAKNIINKFFSFFLNHQSNKGQFVHQIPFVFHF